MAFFGLTALGTEDVFDASSTDKLDIVAFTEEEIKATFDEFDADDNGHMDTREIEALLTKLFRGPPRDNEKKLFMETFDTNNDGKVTWAEFSSTIKRLKEEDKDRRSKVSSGCEFTSYEDLKTSRRKHTRCGNDPRKVLKDPVTSSQQVGFSKEQATTIKFLPKTSCDETKYMSKMLEQGNFI